MKLRIKKFEVSAGRAIIFIHKSAARKMDVSVGDRVKVRFDGKSIIGRVDIVDDFLTSKDIALSEDILSYLGASFGKSVALSLVSLPKSAVSITKKMNGKKLSRDEIFGIIRDVVDNALTEAEIAQFVVAVYKNGMSRKETIWLTEAIYKTGAVLKWDSNMIADKHCIGGIAGNRTTPIVVSICAAAGIIMPKTSSRAITSAAGTADTVETLAKVDFPAQELKAIVKKTKACLAWGGSLGLAPADDKLIKVERVLNLDPESQLLASILSKKLAVGSKYVLIDIPYGEGAKVSKLQAEKLKFLFISLGKNFGLKMKVVLTDGSQPIGNGIGPVLEMIDVLKVLRQESDAPKDLEQKSVMLSGILMEMMGKAKSGKGVIEAQRILNSGLAFKKFKEIIEAQHGQIKELKPAHISEIIEAHKSGTIKSIDNKGINYVATILGCPQDKQSGIFLKVHKGDKVKKGDELAILYAEADEKMNEGKSVFNTRQPIKID